MIKFIAVLMLLGAFSFVASATQWYWTGNRIVVDPSHVSCEYQYGFSKTWMMFSGAICPSSINV